MNVAYIKQLAYKYQAVDWAVVGVLLILIIIFNTAAYPYCRPFQWNDASINHPYKADTFPVYALALMAIFTPIFYIAFSRLCVEPLRKVLGEPLSLLAPEPGEVDLTVTLGVACGGSSINAGSSAATLEADRKPRVADPVKLRSLRCSTGPVYAWVKAHLWALILEMFTVDMTKLYAGRLRPDFLARMRLEGYTEASTQGHDPQTDMEFFCGLMKEHHSLREGRLSFPSGHSGMSAAIFIVTTFYFLAHLRPFARQGSFARLLLSLSPLLVPIFCAVSRTRDNKHNFSDIVAGAFIGIAAALLALAVTFRQTGGPLALYLARTNTDIEYVKQQLIANGGGGSAIFSRGGLSQRRTNGGDYQAATVGGSVELRATAGTAPSTMLDDGATVAVPIGNGGRPASVPSSPLMGAPGGGNDNRVVVVTTVGERELNEDPAAVPWL